VPALSEHLAGYHRLTATMLMPSFLYREAHNRISSIPLIPIPARMQSMFRNHILAGAVWSLSAVGVLYAVQGRVWASGPEFPEKVALETSGAPAIWTKSVEGPFAKDASLRFSGVVRNSGLQAAGETHVTPQTDINFRAELVCLAIRQFDAAGAELACDASLGVTTNGTQPLEVEAAPQPGLSSVRLECRMVNVTGASEFSGLRFARNASPLYWPDSMRIVRSEGKTPTWEVGGKVLPSLMVQGQNLETSDNADASIRDTRLPYKGGVRMLSFNAWFEGVTKQDTVANFRRLTAERPEAHFLIRLWLGPQGTFFQDYPSERMAFDDGKHTANVAAPASAIWREYVAAHLRRLTLNLAKLPEATRLAGIVPLYYMTGEWQVGSLESPRSEATKRFRAAGFGDPERRAFKEWALAEHGSLEEINRRWRTKYASAEEIRVPAAADRIRGSAGNFRDPATQAHEIDFARFHSASVADAIVWACGTIKRNFHERILAGVFYGYALEHAYDISGFQQMGHLALGRLVDNPAVDFYGGPYSYNSDNRGFGKPVDFNAVMDSAALHGKMAFLEEDTYTHIAKSPGNFTAPGEHLKTRSLEETLAVLKRNLGVSIARGYILYWMGLLEDGRFDLPEIWEAYSPYLAWLQAHPVRPAYRPQLALVIDERSAALLAEDNQGEVGRWFYELRSILARVDTSLGIYLQSDLDRIPDSVRCLVLANAWEWTERDRQVLRDRWMKNGRTIVFCGLADAFAPGGLAEAPGSLTGIKMELVKTPIQPVSIAEGGGLFDQFAGEEFAQPVDRAQLFWRKHDLPPLSPHYVVSDPGAQILARYRDDESHRGSVARKKMDGWTSVFTAAHSLTPLMWRAIVADSGAHFYLDEPSEDFDSPDVVEATDDFLMIQSGRGGDRTIRLPGHFAQIEAFDSDRPETLAENTDRFSAKFQKSVPRFFLLRR
jgi:hypothetical protein